MTKRQIPYNNAAATLRYEYDPSWDPQTITGVTLTVTDLGGSELLAADAATLWTATTMSAASSVGDTTITLTAATLSPGDRLSIAASADGPNEEVIVKYYNSSTKVATLTLELKYGHASGTAVKGMWATYDIDTSVVATFPAAKQVRLVWTPAGSDDLARTEDGEISIYAAGVSDFAGYFTRNFSREARIVAARGPSGFEDLHADSILEISAKLQFRGLLMDRLVNQTLLKVPIAQMARLIVARAGGDRWAAEIEQARKDFQIAFEDLCSPALYSDDNQDGVQSENEIDDHSGAQLLGSENSI
jgi:hypothetical protein